MRILVLSSDVPITSKMPGSPRLFNLCQELAKRHRLSLMYFPQTDGNAGWNELQADLQRVFSAAIRLPKPPASTWLRKKVHSLLRAPTGYMGILNPAYAEGIRDRIRKSLESDPVDLIFTDGHIMTQYFPGNLPVPVAVDMCDCYSLLIRRFAKLQKHPYGKLVSWIEAISVARWEAKVARTYPLLFTISPVDRTEILKLAPGANVLVVPNGVDCDYFHPSDKEPEGQRIIFTGVMSYLPNVDAAVHFAREIFPLVKARMPGAEFWLVGQDPSAEVRELEKIPGVTVTGTVEDVRPHIHAARIFVSPLRFGAGLKNKILVAMAMGKATVATPLSMDGIDLRPETDLLIGTEPDEFARQVIRLLEDSELSRTMERTGRELVLQNYSWASAGKMLEDAMIRLARSR